MAMYNYGWTNTGNPSQYYAPQPQGGLATLPAQQSMPQNNSVMMVLVNGEDEAKNYPVGPGGSLFLMDSSNCRFYTKSVDFSGIATFKCYEFAERGSENSPGSDFVTREEFEKLKAHVYRRKTNEPTK